MNARSALGVLGLVLLAATPSKADWLITKAGARVETRGPWQVKGKLVVFTQNDGSLSSLRLSEVDLEASTKATADAKLQAEAPPPPPEPARKKLAVLTDQNFRKKSPAASAQPEAGPPTASGPVSVSSWKQVNRPGGDGIEVEGTLHNNTEAAIINAAVEVQLYNEVGDRVGTSNGVLSSTSIQPKGTAEFRASFPGTFTFANVKFEAKGWPLDISPAPQESKPPN
ncbi:MAG: FxLYD domain-containing protein [Thermoanaerobaculia bacterium]